MKLNLEDISAIEKKLTVTIDKDKVSEEYGKIFSKIRGYATIKGFRKGKAPRSVIEGSYGAKINEELVTKLVEGSFTDALKEKELNPIAQPAIKITPYKKGEDFTYSMTVELMPEFDLADYSGMELTGGNSAVEDSEVDDALTNLQAQYALFNETADDRKARDNDMVTIDYKGFLADGTPIKDGEKEDSPVFIGAKKLIAGFEENLIGLGKGEVKEFTVTFPKDYFEKEYAGVDVRFKVKVKEIKERELPKLDDDFAKTLGEYNTFDELKGFIRTQLEEEKKKTNTYKVREQIVDKLIDLNKFDIPNSLVERQIDYIVHEAKQRLARQGADVTKLSGADSRENSRELALKMVKRDIILSKVVEKEELMVEPGELEARYADMAKNMKKPVEEIKKHYKQVNAEQAIRDDILIQKVFDKITDTANIATVKEGA